MDKIIGLFLLIMTTSFAWSQDIEFTYEFETFKSIPDLVNVNARITNNSGNNCVITTRRHNSNFLLLTQTTIHHPN